MKSIIGIGNAVTDIPVVLKDGGPDEFGFRPGSMNHIGRADAGKLLERLQGQELEYVPGGSAANTIVAAAALGMRGGFIGKVGRDSIGELYGQTMAQEGVEALLLKGDLPSGRAVTFITPDDGERTFATYLGAALELTPQQVREEMFNGYDYLHVEGYLMQCGGVVEKAVSIARSKGMTVSFDMGSFGIVRNFHERVRSIVADYADIVFANELEAEAFTGMQGADAVGVMHDMMHAAGKIAVVKLGAGGSAVTDGRETERVEAFPADVVDTTGAGDAYAAGFLYAHSMGAGIGKCALAGSLLASLVVQEVGPKISKCGWKVAKSRMGNIL